jgi:site-specific recombinase XerD
MIPILPPSATISFANLIPQADAYAAEAKSPSTRRAYRTAWRQFSAWCEANALQQLPAAPEAVAVYLAHLAEKKKSVSTIDKALGAIAHAHHRANLLPPNRTARVQETMRGIRRSLGVAQTPKAPLLANMLRAACADMPSTIIGLRDRALLTLGFAGAFRRSELVALEVRDLTFTAEGLEVTIRRSKTDQDGKGRRLGIPLAASPKACPVRALQEWLAAAKIDSGAILRAVDRHGRVSAAGLTGRSVALIVKRHVSGLGLDQSRYAGHSLRAGLVTSAAKAGRSEASIMRTTGHRSSAMVRRYIRDISLFQDNAADGLL